MSTIPDDYYYYPALSSLITIDALPEVLSFIKNGIQDIFSKIYYKDYQSSISFDGSSAFYSLEIISQQRLDIQIPGTDIYLILNADYTDSSISSFPITLFWEWDIIRFINDFNVSGFSFLPEDLFDLGLLIFNISERQVISAAINSFVTVSDPTLSKFNQLVSDVNQIYGFSIVIDPNSTDPVADLIVQLNLLGKQVTPTIFILYLASDPSKALYNINYFFSGFLSDGIANYIKQVIIPKARATLELTAALEFPRNILLPMVHNPDGSYTPDMTTDVSGNLKKSYIQFGDAILDVDTATGFGYQTDFSGTLLPQYAQIGNTFLIISFSDVKLDLSQTTNIPEADAAGYPVDFVGAYVKEASVIINGFGKESSAHESVSLTVQNFLVGSGGVTGTITLASSGALYRDFGDFAVELDVFSLTFRQGAITNSNISGKITLPSGFSGDGEDGASVIQIDGHIMDNGDFSVTGTFLGEKPTFTFPNVFTVAISKLELGEKGGHFYLSIAGTLDFIADIPVLGQVLPQDIVINKFIIWDDGHIEFDGGKLTVPQAFRVHVGPVSLEVYELSLGSHKRMHNGIERSYYYIGFDGMLNAGNTGVSVGGNGLKYYFSNDDGPGKPFDQYLSIDGIMIDLSIPASDPNFILYGFLSMKNPDVKDPDAEHPEPVNPNTETEYLGKIFVSLPKLRVTGSAAMRLKPDVPSFVVDVDLELPVAIPLGPTGLGIYGLRGLIGQHYSPSKTAAGLTEDATWWDYYKAPGPVTHREGIDIDKFDDHKQGFSLGLGAALATEFDTGFILSTKVFLLLGLPDVFLIQGQAAIISGLIGLDDDVDPPFTALIVISNQSVMGNLGVDFNLPNNKNHPDDKGWIVSLKAQLEMAFFFNNASGWYLNIGKDKPATAMVQASLLTIFKGHFYLMISSQGIKAGAGIAYDFNRKFGPVQVGFGAALDMGGFISFKPVQIGGFIQVSGYAYLKVWKFKFGLSIAIALAMEAPHPFNITGSLKVKLNLPWPIPDIKFTLEVSWHFNDDLDLTQVPVLNVPDPTVGYLPAAGINILSNESFPINYVTTDNLTTIPPPGDAAWKYNFTDATDVLNVIIPLDTFVDIELLKPVTPGDAPIGGASSQLPVGYTELIPPVKGVKAQVKHQYELRGLGLYAWDAAGSAWVPYNVYEAVTAIVDSNTGPDAVDFSTLKPGYWQFVDKDKYNKIRLLSQNMFSFSNGTITDQLDMDGRGFRAGDVFCFDQVFNTNAVNWKDVAADTGYPDNVPVPVKTLMFTFTGITASVKNETSFNATSLFIDGGNGEATITFPEPVVNVKLEFGDNSNNVTVKFIEPVYLPGIFGKANSADVVISTATLAATQQNGVITYDNDAQPISKIKLDFAQATVPGYTGDLVLGGHLQLPSANIPAGLNGNMEMDRALLFSALYNQSFTATEVLALEHSGQAGLTAQWSMDGTVADSGSLNGVLTGSPDTEDGFYKKNSSQLGLHSIYRFTANEDAMIIPNAPAINIENGSFAAEVSVAFNPFAAGISTLLYKVSQDEQTGAKKGYAIHLVQATPANAQTRYPDQASIPQFSILFTCYNETGVAAVTASDKYMINCDNSTVAAKQYKRVLVSVNRVTGKLDLYIGRVLKTSVDIPAELGISEAPAGSPFTYLNQVTYTTETMQQRQADSTVTNTSFINEVSVLNDTINRTIQPVWRPETTFAVMVKTFDKVNNTSTENIKTHIFGFKTAGPLGHYHQYSKTYQDLAANDQADAFKLANLKNYINYDRSFPDAQGRYDLSKPVFYHNPQVKLYFDQPYLNAMYHNWDSYQGLPAISSKLDLELLDTAGNILTSHLVWDPVQEIPVNGTNYSSLPRDQQLIYLFNHAASHGGCNPMDNELVKKLTQGSYQFPDLIPGTLYTARFNAVYQPTGQEDPDSVEVHKFGFITSRYATFQEQAGSFILDATPGAEKYVLHAQPVAFAADYIDQTLKKLIDADLTDDPDAVMKYAVPYDRLVYGGLKLAAPEPLDTTAIALVINTDPADLSKTLLGILVYNPEPFNEPKLPAESVPDTIRLTMTLADESTLSPGDFIYIYSGDNSAVFITNTDMSIPSGSIQLSFKYKIFNGIDYETVSELFDGPVISITPWF